MIRWTGDLGMIHERILLRRGGNGADCCPPGEIGHTGQSVVENGARLTTGDSRCHASDCDATLWFFSSSLQTDHEGDRDQG
jgi:hypothetical protein